jgi:predicted ATPase
MGEGMLFQVVASTPSASQRRTDTVYLAATGWDDWFQFSTLFNVAYIDRDGMLWPIGQTKIGEFGLEPARKSEPKQPGFRSPAIPSEFGELGREFFSLGQDTSYYEALTGLGENFREQFLQAINDIAHDGNLRLRAEREKVTAVSLLRDVPLRTVRDQFARLARGDASLTPYDFSFRIGVKDKPTSLRFSVKPNSQPPTNIHVLIGRNGVGKSTALNTMARTIVQLSQQSEDAGNEHLFFKQVSNVVSVSFSAFDQFAPLGNSRDRTKRLAYHYIGLKKMGAKAADDAPLSDTKSSAAIAREMSDSLKTCLAGAARHGRLVRAVGLLESDPIFAESGFGDLIREEDTDTVLEELPGIFGRFSSGHKIVLLTITKLVETVEEKSLVLIDEPEAHLHPPLLSAFVRALSDLLTNRNGMAVVATHSPVVLQEVPRSCVLKMHRWGDELSVERPTLETFGENVGTLTDEIFGLEVTATGFHKMLAEISSEAPNYESALERLGEQLGAEGRAMLRAMYAVMPREYHVGN